MNLLYTRVSFKSTLMTNFHKNLFVYDIECTGLLDEATQIHCLSIAWLGKHGQVNVKSTTDYESMKKFFSDPKITRVGHNITLYDEMVVTKLLGINTAGQNECIIDTLALSWYLYPEKKKHGLEEWGNELGVQKVAIADWLNLSTSEYIERCEQDVRINMKLWQKFYKELMAIYDANESEIIRFIEYLQFKLDCFREQAEEKIRLDIMHIQVTLNKLRGEAEYKTSQLESVMPKVPIKQERTFENVILIDEDNFCVKGDMLYDHYFREGYKTKRTHTFETITGFANPNANSVAQKKNWLFSLGWKPQHWKEVKDEKTGKIRKVPQITSKLKDGSLCESVKLLYKKEPTLELLEGLSILSHRIGLLEGILKYQKDGYIEASMSGFTNTLRIKHSKVVNLPGVKKPYGEDIRGSFVSEKDGILCGSDMSSLEDSTKQHYIYNYDPKYVQEMRTPGFDPHLDIAVLAKLLTAEQAEKHKAKEEDYGEIRSKAKVVNFSATYGAGAPTIAETAGIPLKEGKLLHKIYWKRNKAVKDTAADCVVKTIGNKKWLLNPVSGFWYSLRAEKDRFSTLNQGTGVYCFDLFVRCVRKRGIKVCLQMHDEILFKTTEKDKTKVEQLLNEAIEEVNNIIRLNVPLGISMEFGKSYAAVH